MQTLEEQLTKGLNLIKIVKILKRKGPQEWTRTIEPRAHEEKLSHDTIWGRSLTEVCYNIKIENFRFRIIKSIGREYFVGRGDEDVEDHVEEYRIEKHEGERWLETIFNSDIIEIIKSLYYYIDAKVRKYEEQLKTTALA